MDEEQPRRVNFIMQLARERLKLNPKDVDALFALAAAQATLNDAKSGAQTLERLAEIEPNYPGLWPLKTKLHAQLGEPEKARQSRLRGQQSEPASANAASRRFQCPICEALVPADATTYATCGVKFEPSESMVSELDDLSLVAIQEMVQEELGASKKPDEAHPKPLPKPASKPTAAKGLTNGLARGDRGGPKGGKTNGLRGRTNGLRGRTNGLRGRTNGLTNGLRGRTNGLTNGVGRTNGLTNGLGHTNGLTNGLGRTNGLTNGLGPALQSATSHASRRQGAAHTAGWKLYLIPLVAVSLLLLPLFLVPQYGGSTYPIQIDGQFNDWNGVPKLAPTGPATLNPDIDILHVALTNNRDYLSFYIEVRGSALAGGPLPSRLTNAFYAFVDVDGSTSTGYRVQGIGADRMIRINTWGGIVVSASLMTFNTSRGPTDWNGWVPSGPAFAAGSGGRIEFETSWQDLAGAPGPLEVAFASRSWDGQSDAADPVATNADPFVLVSQETAAPFVASNGTVLSRVTLRSVDGNETVQGLNLSFQGTFRVSSITSVSLVDATGSVLSTKPFTVVTRFAPLSLDIPNSSSLVLSVRVDGVSADGTTVGAFIRDVEDISVSAGGTAFLHPVAGPESLAYLGFVPSQPTVDGAFREWQNATGDPVGDVQPVWDQDVDLTGYGFRGFAGSTYFMASVLATALNGTIVPSLNPGYTPPSNGTGNGTLSAPPPPENGTDSLRFLLDSDGNGTTGYTIGGIGADYLIEITGKNGEILSSTAMRFNGASANDWKWASLGAVPAAKDRAHIEAELASIAIANASRAYFQATGWNGAFDDSLPSNPPISVLVASGMALPAVGTPKAGSLSSQSFGASIQAGTQQWFFTNSPAAGGISDCPTPSNKFTASLSAGMSPTSLGISNGAAICWYTANPMPAPVAGTATVSLDISGSGTYTVTIIHCGTGSCGQRETLGTQTSSSYGSPVTMNVTIVAPTGTWGNPDFIEFRVTAPTGGSVTVTYNGNSGSNNSNGVIPVPEFNSLIVVAPAIVIPTLFRRGLRRRARHVRGVGDTDSETSSSPGQQPI